MTQKTDPKPGRNDRRISELSVGSAEDYPVSPGFLAAVQLANLDGVEPLSLPPPRTPPITPPNLRSRSRSRAAQDSVQTPRRRMSRGVRLTPKACESMHKASQSRALQMENEEMEMERSSSPMSNGRMAEDDLTPQTDEADADARHRPGNSSAMAVMATSSPVSSFPTGTSTPAAYSDFPESLADFTVPHEHVSEISTRLPSHPPTSQAVEQLQEPSSIRYQSANLVVSSVNPTQTWQEVHVPPPHDFTSMGMDMDTTMWAQDTYSTSAGSYPQHSLPLPPNWQAGAPFSHQHLYPSQFLPSNRAPQYVPQQLGGQLISPRLVSQQLGGQLNGPGQHIRPGPQYAASPNRSPGGHLISPHLAPQQLGGQHGEHGNQYAAVCSPVLPKVGLDSNRMVLLSRPASSQSMQGSQYHMPLPQSGGPIMAITPPTPATGKDKGKQRERLDIAMAAHSNSEAALDAPEIPTTNTGSPPVSTGSLSKSTQSELNKLFQKIAELIAEASGITQLPAERITKFLGKRLGLNVRGSTLWNGYQTYFTAHMKEQLQGIGAEEEYANASSAQKPAIVARAQTAFKAKYKGHDEWQTILKAWDDLKTVDKGCGGQTIGTRENNFDAMNRKVAAFLDSQSIQNSWGYVYAACGSQKTDVHLNFMSSAALSDGFLLQTSRSANMDEFMKRMQAYVIYQAEEKQTRRAFGEDDIDNPFAIPSTASGSSGPSPAPSTDVTRAITKKPPSDARVIRNMFREGFAAAGGTSKGDQMPWLNMVPSLDEQDIQMREYPFEIPFPSEIETAPKGVESLTAAQLAVLKESFLHPRNPITFHKVDKPISAGRMPVIISTVSTSLPLRRRYICKDNKPREQLVSSPGEKASSKVAALSNPIVSDSEPEASALSTLPKTKTRSKSLMKGDKDENSVRRGAGGSLKRAHSVTEVSSGSPSDPHTPDNTVAKRTRFQESDSSIEVGELTPAPTIMQRAAARITISAKAAAFAANTKTVKTVKAKVAKGKKKQMVISPEFVNESDGEDDKNKVDEKPTRPKPRPKGHAAKAAKAALESSPLTPVPPSPVKPADKRASEAEASANLKTFGAPYPSSSATTARPSPESPDPFTLMGSAPPTALSKTQQVSAAPAPALIPSAAQTGKFASPRPPLLTPTLRKLPAHTPAHAPAVPETHCEAALQGHREDSRRRVAPPPQHQYGAARNASMTAESERLSEELSDSGGRVRAPSSHTLYVEPHRDNRYHHHPDYEGVTGDYNGSSYPAYSDGAHLRSDSDRIRPSRRDTAPERRREVAPGGRHEAAPEHRREAASESGREAAPEIRRIEAPGGRHEAAPEYRREARSESSREATLESCREAAPAGRREAAPESRRETSSHLMLDSGPPQRQRAATYDSDYGRSDFNREHTPHYHSQSNAGYYSRRSQSPEHGARPPVYYQPQYRSPSPQAGPSRRPYQDPYYHRPPSPQSPRRSRQETHHRPPSSQAGSSRGSSRRQFQDTQSRHSPYPDGSSGGKMDVGE